MPRFRKKPIEIEAVQWLKHGDHEKVKRYLPSHEDIDTICPMCSRSMHKEHGYISTFEGPMTVCPEDWIIRGIKGEYYPCKPDIFKETYELVD